ncbi:MAG: sugar phosphate nucleotidyltransferase [Terriglobales bacterium]
MDAAVLCGGLGTRLRAALPGIPKCLAPVGGQPFLAKVLEQLTGAGCRRIVLCIGAQTGGEAVREYCASRAWGTEIAFSEEPAPLGTGGALALARPLLTSDPVCVVNGDSIVPGLDFAAVLRAYAESHAAGTMVTVARTRSDTGAVQLDEGGRVRAFAEKSAAPGAAYENAGVAVISQDLLRQMQPGPSSLERDWMPAWIGKGFHGYVHPGPLYDIGTPERWAQAQAPLARS